jgi:hypothetical protein
MKWHPKRVLAALSILPATLAILVATMPAVTSLPADATGTSTPVPPSFPEAALSSIPVPTNCTPPTELPPKQGASMAYAPASNTLPDGNLATGVKKPQEKTGDRTKSSHDIVLFGGMGTLGLSNETWIFNGSSWKELHLSNSPQPREGATLIYDRSKREDILFGGKGTNGLLSDTWSWNGNNWQELYPKTSPSPRAYASGAYALLQSASYNKEGNRYGQKHHAIHGVILFGGKGNNGLLSDTWSWNGDNWQELHPKTSPSPREQASMAYSPGRHGNSHGANSSGNTGRDNNPSSDGQGNGHGVVLFGGKGTNGLLSDTWSWNGNNWQELYPKTSPSPRYGASMSFSPGLHGKATRNRDNSPHPEDHIQHHGHHRTIGDGNGHGVVLFGGKGNNGLLSDTWSWNGDNWQELSPVTSPPALTSTASSFDPSKDEVVVATGSGASGATGDTWAFNGRNWKEIGRGAVAPSSPTSVLTSAGDNAIYANFHAPASDNGAPIAGYVAVAEPGGEYGVVSGCNPSTSVTITGLTNGTSYLVYVFAVSVGGISAASSPSYATIPFGKPYPPTNLVATPANGSATITWDVPYDNGSPITSYTITASPGGDTETLTQTSATLSNLEDGVTYVVTATATNTAGTSLPSLPVTVTPEGTPSLPGTPSNLKAYPVKNAATVTWSPPAGNGSPVSSYTLTATPVTAALLSSDAQVVEPPVSSGGVSGTSPGIAALPKRLPMATSTPSVSSPNPCIVWWKSTCELYNSLSDPTQTGDPVSTWTLVHESKLQGSTIMTITCPSTTECIAVGYMQSTTPETISPVVWRTTDAGATWTQEQLSSSSGSYIELDAISCSSTADCVTVGGNGIGAAGIGLSNSGPTAIFATTDGGVTWTQEPVPVDVVDVSGISCPSTTTCYASGTYMTSSSGARPVIIESTNAGSSWSIVYLPSVVYGWLSRISCTSTTTCTAVGIQATIDYSTTPIQEQIGGYSITTSNAGASWSSSLIASGSYNLSTGTAAVAPMPMDISCTTPSNCTTDGFTAYVSVTSSGATISTITPFSYETTNQAQSWTKSVLPSLPSGTSGGLLGISCAGLSCIATGDTIDTSNQISSPLLYQSQDMGASFVQEYLPTPPTGQTYVLYGAYCFTDGSCYVTGGVGSSSTISYGAIFENTPTKLICPPLPVPQLPSGATPAPPGSKTVVITYNTPYPLSAAVISNLQPGVAYMIEMSAGNSLGEGCAVAPVPAVVTIDSSSNCSGCGGPVSLHQSCTLGIFCSNGPVQEYPRVFLIFWGVDPPHFGQPLGASPSVTNRIALTNLFSDLAGSGYYNIFHHYGVTGYAGLQGYYYDTSAPSSLPSNYDSANAQIGNEINKVIKRGICKSASWTDCWHMSKPSSQRGVGDSGWLNTQFVVVPANRVGVTKLMSDKMLNDGCAYHAYSGNHIFDFNPDPGNPWEQENCQYVNEQGRSFGDFTANLTEYASHEFAEAATDPFGNAWHANNGDEIGDICQNMTNYPSYLPGHTQVVVQLLWSNIANACVGEAVHGYRQLAYDGAVYDFGDASFQGSAYDSDQAPFVKLLNAPTSNGYWILAQDGAVYSENAHFWGSEYENPHAPFVDMATNPSGTGYWILAQDGSVWTLGNVAFYGAPYGQMGDNIAVGIASTPDGHGYWIVDSAGHVFNYGDAPLIGYTGPYGAGISVLADAYGAWVPGPAGAVYTLGSAQSFGNLSSGGCSLAACPDTMAAVFEDQGYYLSGSDGSIYPFGDAPYEGNSAHWTCHRVTIPVFDIMFTQCFPAPLLFTTSSMAVTP